jgi:signal recognition particle subunit SRP54
VVSVTGKPIIFAATGEKPDALEEFHPDRMADRILDLGDLLTLIEQAEQKISPETTSKAASKLLGGGKFDFNDFLDQLEQVQKLGSLSSIARMIPGMGKYSRQLESFDERELDWTKAAIQSMTPAERSDPALLVGSRRQRVAKGAGISVSRMDKILKNFKQIQKSMAGMGKFAKALPKGVDPNADIDLDQLEAGGGLPAGFPAGGMGNLALPNLGSPMGLGHGGGSKRKNGKKKSKNKKGRSGNPAKRAQQEGGY